MVISLMCVFIAAITVMSVEAERPCSKGVVFILIEQNVYKLTVQTSISRLKDSMVIASCHECIALVLDFRV